MSKVVVLAAICIASFTAFLSPLRAQANSEAAADNTVTYIGTVSCSKCQGIQPLHKGYTRWTWALHSLSEGDDIVLVVGNKMYKLQGDKDEVLKYMEKKAKVTGDLDGQTLIVKSIVRPEKNERASLSDGSPNSKSGNHI
jgi:hypothetical protein